MEQDTYGCVIISARGSSRGRICLVNRVEMSGHDNNIGRRPGDSSYNRRLIIAVGELSNSDLCVRRGDVLDEVEDCAG